MVSLYAVASASRRSASAVLAALAQQCDQHQHVVESHGLEGRVGVEYAVDALGAKQREGLVQQSGAGHRLTQKMSVAPALERLRRVLSQPGNVVAQPHRGNGGVGIAAGGALVERERPVVAPSASQNSPASQSRFGDEGG
jgi:hypothetical protein